LGRQNKLLVELTLTQDCKFLQDHTVMDYSFLLGIHNVDSKDGTLVPSSPHAAAAMMATTGVSVKNIIAANIDTPSTTNNGSSGNGGTTPRSTIASTPPPLLHTGSGSKEKKRSLVRADDSSLSSSTPKHIMSNGNHRISIFQRDRGGLASNSGHEIYFLGIIDILQPYNARKRLETGTIQSHDMDIT
jgi:hypothetical protein